MPDHPETKAQNEGNKAPDVGGPGQPHLEQTFGKAAEAQSRSDLRDRRGGATDVVDPPEARRRNVRHTRTPHGDTTPRRPAPDAVGQEPEGLKRERKGPLSPSRGRASDSR